MQRKDQFGHERGFYKWLISPICEAIDQLSKEIAATRRDIKRVEKKMAGEFDKVIASSRKLLEASDGIMALCKTISDLLKNSTDPRMVELAAELDAKAAAVSASIVENTPAADEPPPVDPPVPIDPAARGRR